MTERRDYLAAGEVRVMSEKTDYRQLLEDVCRAVGVDTKRPKQSPRPYELGETEPKPDCHLRDDLMRRLGVLTHEDTTESIQGQDSIEAPRSIYD